MRPQTVTAATLEQEHLRELESQRRHLTNPPDQLSMTDGVVRETMFLCSNRRIQMRLGDIDS